MRYLKVLLMILLFFLVTLFFVDNQGAFSYKLPLKLDLRIFPPISTEQPIPCYFMLLACFLLGSIITLLMLVWDRLSLSTRLSLCRMRSNGLEKDLNRARKTKVADAQKSKELLDKIAELNAEIATLKSTLKDTEARLAQAEQANAKNA